MNYINTTFSYGNGPYCRTTDLALAVNSEFEKRGGDRMGIIMPLVYGDKQKEIMLNEFPIIKEKSDLILLDETQGAFLKELFYHQGSYAKNLEFFLANQKNIETKIRDYLSGTLNVKTFDNKKIKIPGGDVSLEISYMPQVATGYKKSFYASVAFFSEILERTLKEKDQLGFDLSLLEGAREISEKIESDRTLHFLPEPSVFSYDLDRKKKKKEIFTPPHIHTPPENNEGVEKGIYVTITGVDGLRPLFNRISEFGMKLYCPPSIRDIKESDNTHPPSFISNSNIKYHFARTGWSSVWLSLLTGVPLITPAFSKQDDPEIFFNEKTMRKFGLAAILDNSQDIPSILREADRISVNYNKIKKSLKKTFGTLDGINYTAKIIANSVQGEDISHFQDRKSIFSEK